VAKNLLKAGACMAYHSTKNIFSEDIQKLVDCRPKWAERLIPREITIKYAIKIVIKHVELGWKRW
jgi:hypothetical protein